MAQPYASDLGRFEVDQIKGCVPLTVNVNILPPFVCNGANPCDMDFENNNMFQSLAFNHTYTQPGIYTLRILFQTSGFDQITIEVTPDIPPAFDLYRCSGNGVQVNITDTNYDQYVINYNDGNPVVVVPSGSMAQDNHIFATSGNKTVTVRGRNLGANDNCTPMNQALSALALLPTPSISTLTVLDNTSLRLDFNNQNNILYRLQMATNGGAFQPFMDVYNSGNAVATGLSTDANYYCFRLGAFDPCNATTAYSNTICSADFDLTVMNNSNRLTWSTQSAGVTNFSITKTGSPSLVAPAGTSVLDDPNVVCGTDYCYQMTTNYANGSTSISLEKCGQAFSTIEPPAPENISIAIDNNAVARLSWTQDPAFSVDYYSIRKDGVLLGTTPNAMYDDVGFTVVDAGCYTIQYLDECGNISTISKKVCPVIISAKVQADNAILLTWNSYNGWNGGVDYYILEKFDAQGQLIQSYNTGISTTFTDDDEDFVNQVYIYRITAYPNEIGVGNSNSNALTVKKDSNIFYPNAFTPNGDLLNDVFKVFSQYTSNVQFQIYNRWGELLFFTDDITQGWDGTFKGKLMPEGTYYFKASLIDLTGHTEERSGTILLLHKTR
jgi:gliding motility-associated-like protein